ncbi:peptidase containing protein [Acinetobacter phage nACB2]|nr:peptidase containing protein [Acinetobacter phage nACB2]
MQYSKGSKALIIEEIQTALKQLGYYNGLIDGVFGSGTENAVKAYQKDNGLISDGIVGVTTAGHLGIQLGLQPSDMYQLTERCVERLKGIHPDLVKVVERAIQLTPVQFKVGEGLRTLARQKELMKQGATQTMNSRHLTGHAVDLHAYVNGTVSWDWKYYYQIEEAVKQAAKELKVSIEWGGDWKSFKDGPHWQLPWNKYPK